MMRNAIALHAADRRIGSARGLAWSVVIFAMVLFITGCGSGGASGSKTTVEAAATQASTSSAPTEAWATTVVGNQPSSEADDPLTHTLYVSNSGDGTLSMINTSLCNVLRPSGCSRDWPVVKVGASIGVAVDEATRTVYVANAPASTVSLLDAATCNASDTSGCHRRPATVRVGRFDNGLAIDRATNVIYVVNQDASTVSMIDGNACNARMTAGCAQQPFVTVPAGGGDSGVEVNARTNTVYVANTGQTSNNQPLRNGNTLSLINGRTCLPTEKRGCLPIATVKVGAAPADLTFDPAANTLYVSNTYDGTGQLNGTISIVDGAKCDAMDPSGCRALHSPEVTAQQDPGNQGFDPVTRKAYFANFNSNTLSVINAAQCSARNLSACSNYRPATIAAGNGPSAVLPVPASHTIYVVDQRGNVLTLLPEK